MITINGKNYLSVVGISKKTLGKDCAMKSLWYTDEETKDQIKCAGYLGALLMTYYKAIAMQENPDMEDKTLARKHLGVSVISVQRARLNLAKGNWFLRRVDKRKGKETIIYLVGKIAVNNYLKGVVVYNSSSNVK